MCEVGKGEGEMNEIYLCKKKKKICVCYACKVIDRLDLSFEGMVASHHVGGWVLTRVHHARNT